VEGLNAICSVCNKKIIEKDIEKGNTPMRIANIPGYVHKKCKAEFDMDVIGSAIIDKVYSKDSILKEEI